MCVHGPKAAKKLLWKLVVAKNNRPSAVAVPKKKNRPGGLAPIHLALTKWCKLTGSLIANRHQWSLTFL